MFRFVAPRLSIGAYSLFMIEQKNHPKLKGLAVAERGKLTSKLYKSLSPQEMTALKARAAKYPTPERKSKGGKVAKAAKASKEKTPRTASPYAQFVKANIGKFKDLPQRDRMKAVAKLWSVQAQRTGSK